jgi:hypothetical protein
MNARLRIILKLTVATQFMRLSVFAWGDRKKKHNKIQSSQPVSQSRSEPSISTVQIWSLTTRPYCPFAFKMLQTGIRHIIVNLTWRSIYSLLILCTSSFSSHYISMVISRKALTFIRWKPLIVFTTDRWKHMYLTQVQWIFVIVRKWKPLGLPSRLWQQPRVGSQTRSDEP